VEQNKKGTGERRYRKSETTRIKTREKMEI
jgi:hypothetical protein